MTSFHELLQQAVSLVEKSYPNATFFEAHGQVQGFNHHDEVDHWCFAFLVPQSKGKSTVVLEYTQAGFGPSVLLKGFGSPETFDAVDPPWRFEPGSTYYIFRVYNNQKFLFVGPKNRDSKALEPPLRLTRD